MGLLTGETRGEVQDRTEELVVSVFVPTTPNPTSGWLIFVPRNSLQELSMSVDDAFKMIISGGILTPETAPLPGLRPSLRFIRANLKFNRIFAGSTKPMLDVVLCRIKKNN